MGKKQERDNRNTDRDMPLNTSIMSDPNLASLAVLRQLVTLGLGQSTYWAGKSIQRGLPAFQAIVENKALGIDITVSSAM